MPETAKIPMKKYDNAGARHVTMARARNYREGPLQRPFQTYTAASLVRPWIPQILAHARHG
jgi:hypothetical protein